MGGRNAGFPQGAEGQPPGPLGVASMGGSFWQPSGTSAPGSGLWGAWCPKAAAAGGTLAVMNRRARRLPRPAGPGRHLILGFRVKGLFLAIGRL